MASNIRDVLRNSTERDVEKKSRPRGEERMGWKEKGK